MKFAFLIPLRNQAMAKNWQVCVDLCLATIRSAAQQTASADDFQVVLVCRDFPEVSIESHVNVSDHFKMHHLWSLQSAPPLTGVFLGFLGSFWQGIFLFP